MAAMSHVRIVGAVCLLAALRAGTVCAADLKVTVQDTRGAPLADIVLYAEPLTGKPARASTPPSASIDQVNKQFVPRINVIETGTVVSFPNSDNIRHSVYSFSPAKVFTTKLYAGRHADPVLFDKPGVVVLGCNIHDSMVAWVRVVDTPYFAKSAADGTGTLHGLPAGDYRVSIWYPGPQQEPLVRQVHVAAEGATQYSAQIDPAALQAEGALTPPMPAAAVAR